jgi:hypothetical protein
MSGCGSAERSLRKQGKQFGCDTVCAPGYASHDSDKPTPIFLDGAALQTAKLTFGPLGKKRDGA